MTGLPTITCPNCGHEYPPGTVSIGGAIIDIAVESGTGEPHRCPEPPRGPAQLTPSTFDAYRSHARGEESLGSTSRGLWQTSPSVFGGTPPREADSGKKARRKRRQAAQRAARR